MADDLLTPAHREILVEALERIAEHTPLQHRTYGRAGAESVRKHWDAIWAPPSVRCFVDERKLLAEGAREGLEGRQDDALLIEITNAIATNLTHDDLDDPRIAISFRDHRIGSLLAASHCANIARRALRSCGLPSAPDTTESGLVELVTAEVEGRLAVEHERLRREDAAVASRRP